MGKLTGPPTHRAIGTLVISKRALAKAQPRAFIEFAKKVTEPWDGARTLLVTIVGAPRTKKNHGKVIQRNVNGKQRRFHVPSDAYALWCASVVAQLAKARQLPNCSWNCAAVFYRDADRGDAVGYYQGLADALEAAGVVSDDKLITQWDGSRLRVDRKNPRVELTLTPVEE